MATLRWTSHFDALKEDFVIRKANSRGTGSVSIHNHSIGHFCGVVLLCFFVFYLVPVRAAEVTVFAAASLTDVLKEVAEAYEKHSEDKIVFNFAASSTLARQIKEGAPTDIFFSADEAKMDGLEAGGHIIKTSRRSLLSNTLVIVAPHDSQIVILSARDLTNRVVSRIALADTRVVPAGIYSKEYLLKLNLWSQIEPKVIPTENVRGALAAVESGNVDAGMVYKTDAAISKMVRIIYEVNRTEGPAISYPVALIKDGPHAVEAEKFLLYLESEDTARTFKRFGFTVLDTAPAR